VKTKTKIAIKISGGSAVTQHVLGDLVIHHLFANFLQCKSTKNNENRLLYVEVMCQDKMDLFET